MASVTGRYPWRALFGALQLHSSSTTPHCRPVVEPHFHLRKWSFAGRLSDYRWPDTTRSRPGTLATTGTQFFVWIVYLIELAFQILALTWLHRHDKSLLLIPP